MRRLLVASALVAAFAGGCTSGSSEKPPSGSLLGEGSPGIVVDSEFDRVERRPDGIVVRRNAQNLSVEIDQSGHGAVGCAWMIYVTLEQYGEACAPGDAETHAMLAEAVGRIDRFVMENGPATPDEIAAGKKRLSDQAGHYRSCGGDLASMYAGLPRDPAALRKSIDDLLSVPRKPVINPCL
jgi:hypothetical protein